MVIYSHSRLSSYENCPLSFKFKYIDEIADINGIEAFMGKQVHEALHHLYKEVGAGRLPTFDEVIAFYKAIWDREHNGKIRIVRKEFSAEDYYWQGLGLIGEYYAKHTPFNENIIGMEERLLIDLDKTGNYVMQGFIDKLIYNEENGIYEVHDYKTSKKLMNQDGADKDRQLALYSIAVKEKYPENNGILLKWHFLRHSQEVTSSRTDEELEKLKKDIIELIKKIEATKDFPAKSSGLCAWCGYNHLCPEYKKMNGV